MGMASVQFYSPKYRCPTKQVIKLVKGSSLEFSECRWKIGHGFAVQEYGQYLTLDIFRPVRKIVFGVSRVCKTKVAHMMIRPEKSCLGNSMVARLYQEWPCKASKEKRLKSKKGE
jgi:hypothetical protein